MQQIFLIQKYFLTDYATLAQGQVSETEKLNEKKSVPRINYCLNSLKGELFWSVNIQVSVWHIQHSVASLKNHK